MDRFRIDHSELPPYFYRVHYEGSSRYKKGIGFLSRLAESEIENSEIEDSETEDSGIEDFEIDSEIVESLKDETHLKEKVIESFTWTNKCASPFINVFSDKNFAENWALKMSRKRDEEMQVFTINTTRLGDITVMKLATLVEGLGINLEKDLRKEAAQHAKAGAYICVLKIPQRAIDAVETIDYGVLNEGNEACPEFAKQVEELLDSSRIRAKGKLS